MRSLERVAGIDEVGRGPLAGPVVAAAVVLPYSFYDDRIKDSKKLSRSSREELDSVIKSSALSWAIIAVGPRRIEALNIREATRLAMSLALRRVDADYAIIDGDMQIETSVAQMTVVKGDALYPQIAAASIIAKVWRDRLMAALSTRYAGYGFETHVGYPTASHRRALETLGPCRIHRLTFKGVSELRPVSSEHSSLISSPSSSRQMIFGKAAV